ncbi:hypothetical protein BEWA_019480 [Theileria equi strain WA]|uniref:Uncharacterized protein n=1 Tax=Theileria equi strain WA TaxID=1537102 RepID=L0AV28_THEEQ|nr:hypothetical protein BEWA_019480 [Theileria equi strain WA]AFZ79103.1 hypothetical protein BEWA_019480 [Theileria equi strain WA]|eukprot:XP_004828769.1 hypothetical protein BEWA_019480 [Theileria equi strain WA]
MRISFVPRFNQFKIKISRNSNLKEIETLVDNYEKALINPELFPAHIQKLHYIATEIRREREAIGISQSDLGVNKLSVKTAERIIYAIYDKFTPELYFVASREPAAIDFYNLYLSSLSDRNNVILKWISEHDINTLGIYILESISTTKIHFSELAKARLLFWKSYPFYKHNDCVQY